MSSSTKDVRQFVRALEGEGCEVTLTSGGNHYRVIKFNNGPMFMPSTPSDHRWLKNAISQLRKEGLPVPPQYKNPTKKKKVSNTQVKEQAKEKGVTVTTESPMAEAFRRAEEAKQEDKKPEMSAKFERYVPAPKRSRAVSSKRKPNIYITKMRGLYLNAQVMEILGNPTRIEVSVNRASAEMMVWSDDEGALTVSVKEGSKNGTAGATGLVRHFDLPIQTRWDVIDSAPGRVLVKWTEEEH